jgi:hypothetical protein
MRSSSIERTDSGTLKRWSKGELYAIPMLRYVSFGIPMSARTIFPFARASPNLGSARVIVEVDRMNSPGVCPFVESMPEGTSSEIMGAPTPLAHRINSAKMPRGADSKPYPMRASRIRPTFLLSRFRNSTCLPEVAWKIVANLRQATLAPSPPNRARHSPSFETDSVLSLALQWDLLHASER